MNKKVVGIIGLLILATVTVAIIKSKEPPAPPSTAVLDASQPMVKAPNPLQRMIESALVDRKWKDVADFLNAEKTEALALVQVLRHVEKTPLLSADQEVLFKTVFEYVNKEKIKPRDRVLGFRIFSNMNLNKSQQKEIRKYFEKKDNKRFKDDLLNQSFVKTIPFPKEAEDKLVREIRAGKDTSRSTESVFLLALVKDPQAKERLNRKMSESFFKLNKGLQPAVAKHLIFHSSETLKREKSYQKMLKFASQQTDESYKELGL